jgi:hypothetical protein
MNILGMVVSPAFPAYGVRTSFGQESCFFLKKSDGDSIRFLIFANGFEGEARK